MRFFRQAEQATRSIRPRLLRFSCSGSTEPGRLPFKTKSKSPRILLGVGMNSLRNQVLSLLEEQNGLTDEEIAAELRQFVPSAHPVLLVCRQLENEGLLKRIKRIGKPSANFLTEDYTPESPVDFAPEPVAEEYELDIPNDSWHLKELHKIGFQHIGEWCQLGDQMTYSIFESGDRSDVLYSFVVDGTIVYLGHTKRSLSHRMNAYHKNTGDSGIERNHYYIQGLLKRGKDVQIYALFDPGTLHFGGHKISLTAGIETSLKEHFRPIWNINQEAA